MSTRARARSAELLELVPVPGHGAQISARAPTKGYVQTRARQRHESERYYIVHVHITDMCPAARLSELHRFDFRPGLKNFITWQSFTFTIFPFSFHLTQTVLAVMRALRSLVKYVHTSHSPWQQARRVS